MSRIQARDYVFKLVYEYEFLKEKNDKSLEVYINTEDTDEADKKFIESSYKDILEHYEEIYGIIETNLERYTMNKITKMDLSILIVAVYEIFFRKEVSHKVAINEAVELAKKYSADNSFKFVNGVLARIVASNANG